MKPILPIILLSFFLASCVGIEYGTLNITYKKCDGTIEESSIGDVDNHTDTFINHINQLYVGRHNIAYNVCDIKKVEFIPNSK